MESSTAWDKVAGGSTLQQGRRALHPGTRSLGAHRADPLLGPDGGRPGDIEREQERFDAPLCVFLRMCLILHVCVLLCMHVFLCVSLLACTSFQHILWVFVCVSDKQRPHRLWFK